MIKLIFSLLIWANARPITIAVIDTGINISSSSVKLCEYGHLDLTKKGLSSPDGHGHNVAHIIGEELKEVDYCLYIIKFFHEYADLGSVNKALRHVETLNPDVVNISFGGPGFNFDEYTTIQRMLKKNIIVVAAAGNNNFNLDNDCDYYPACYDNRIVSVGSINDNGEKSKFSNYGKYVKIWEKGEKLSAGGYTFSGTSQATAVTTGKVAKVLYDKKTKRNSK